MHNIVNKARQFIAPVIQDLGYEVVDIEYKSLYNKMNLTFYIHKEGGVTLDDCQKVNDALYGPLEEYDITDGRTYILNISSPGLDRPLKTDNDLKRNLNTDVEVNLIECINKQYKIVGQLVDFDTDTIVININDTPITINRTNIKLLVPHIKF